MAELLFSLLVLVVLMNWAQPLPSAGPGEADSGACDWCEFESSEGNVVPAWCATS
jgi:hypothetical protein